jgi:hypothetical protein
VLTEPNHHFFVIKQLLRQRLGKLGLADASGAEEQEGRPAVARRKACAAAQHSSGLGRGVTWQGAGAEVIIIRGADGRQPWIQHGPESRTTMSPTPSLFHSPLRQRRRPAPQRACAAHQTGGAASRAQSAAAASWGCLGDKNAGQKIERLAQQQSGGCAEVEPRSAGMRSKAHSSNRRSTGCLQCNCPKCRQSTRPIL